VITLLIMCRKALRTSELVILRKYLCRADSRGRSETNELVAVAGMRIGKSNQMHQDPPPALNVSSVHTESTLSDWGSNWNRLIGTQQAGGLCCIASEVLTKLILCTPSNKSNYTCKI
jgi:hypothetical protein